MIEQIDVFPVRIVSHHPVPLTMPPPALGLIVAVRWRDVFCRALLRLNSRARWQLERGSPGTNEIKDIFKKSELNFPRKRRGKTVGRSRRACLKTERESRVTQFARGDG